MILLIVKMIPLLQSCRTAVTECTVVTSPLIGYNSETPDVLAPPPNWTPEPIFEPMLDVFHNNDILVGAGGIDDWPLI